MFPTSAAARIGGRWAVSRRLFLLACPLLLLSQVMFVDPSTGSGGLGVVVTAGVLSLVAVGAVLWLASVTLLRNRFEQPVAVWVVFAVGGVAGLTRAVVAILVTTAMTDQSLSSSGLAARMVAASLVGATLLPLGAWAIATVEDFATERTHLIDELTNIRMRSMVAQAETLATRELVQQAVGDQLEEVSRDLMNRLALDSSHDMAAALVEASDTRVRPLSHQLWRSEPEPIRVRWMPVVHASMRAVPMPAWPVALLVTSFSLPGAIANRGLPAGLTTAVLVGLCCLGALGSIRRLPTRLRTWPLIVTVFSAWAGALALCGVVLIDLSWQQALPGAFGILIALIGASYAWTLAASANRHASTLLDELEESIDRAEIEAQSAERIRAQAERDAASLIHAHVQGSLLGAAMSLSSGSRDIGDPWLRELIESLPAAPMQLASRPGSLESTRLRWVGLIDVRVEVKGAMQPQDEAAVATIADEAVANAFRHGGASRIDLMVSVLQDAIHFVARANGIAPATNRQIGLGLAKVAGVATEWDLSAPVGGGSELTAVIRL